MDQDLLWMRPSRTMQYLMLIVKVGGLDTDFDTYSKVTLPH